MKDKHLPNRIRVLIPSQMKGVCCNTIGKLPLQHPDQAKVKFEQLKNKLLSINIWNDYTDQTKANFKLYDFKGIPVSRFPVKGDLIKIKLSSYLSMLQRTDDWVEVLDVNQIIANDYSCILLKLRPCSCPERQRPNTDHFFDCMATNTLILYVNSKKAYLSVHGRNEMPNLNPSNKLKILRNIVLANMGFIGFSKMQWQSLIDGLLSE